MSEVKYIKDTFEDYLGAKDYISSSDIKNFLKSPSYYYFKKYKEKDKETKKHFVFGSAAHELFLEPSEFINHYVVIPKLDLRTSAGKAKMAEFELNNQGKYFITDEEMLLINTFVEKATKIDELALLMKDSYREVSCHTIDEKTGLKVRIRPDILRSQQSAIADLKTTTDASPKSFRRDSFSYGYNISAAFYTDFLQRADYLFVALEKNPPYDVTLYFLNDESVETGRQAYRMALDLMRYCYDNDYFCGYNEFEIMKECYSLGNMDKFSDLIKNGSKITIL